MITFSSNLSFSSTGTLKKMKEKLTKEEQKWQDIFDEIGYQEYLLMLEMFREGNNQKCQK